MARLSLQKLVCPQCRSKKELPLCCGQIMEFDNILFFCPTCGREIGSPICCEKMVIRKEIVDIKKELFKNP